MPSHDKSWTDSQLKDIKNHPRDFIRILHMSDTHNEHFVQKCSKVEGMPYGDVLIHSGDFTHKRDWYDLPKDQVPNSMLRFNQLLKTWDHIPTKLVIAGNHELNLHNVSASDIQSKYLTNATYLQDSGYTLRNALGSGVDIQFYGTPWTSSRNMGFSAGSNEYIADRFNRIPDSTQILISHMPPRCIMDIAYCKDQMERYNCRKCGQVHNGRHWGDEVLLNKTKSLGKCNLKLHCFGHVHEYHGTMRQDGILYSNGAMPYEDQEPIIIDLPLSLFRTGNPSTQK